jgi:hypothetical protein
VHSTFFIPGAQLHPARESFKKCDRDPHPKPYIFMIKVTRQIKCIIAQAPGSYNNFTLASPPIPNIKFLSFVVSEKCVILKICPFSIKNHDFTRKKQ